MLYLNWRSWFAFCGALALLACSSLFAAAKKPDACNKRLVPYTSIFTVDRPLKLGRALNLLESKKINLYFTRDGLAFGPLRKNVIDIYNPKFSALSDSFKKLSDDFRLFIVRLQAIPEAIEEVEEDQVLIPRTVLADLISDRPLMPSQVSKKQLTTSSRGAFLKIPTTLFHALVMVRTTGNGSFYSVADYLKQTADQLEDLRKLGPPNTWSKELSKAAKLTKDDLGRIFLVRVSPRWSTLVRDAEALLKKEVSRWPLEETDLKNRRQLGSRNIAEDSHLNDYYGIQIQLPLPKRNENELNDWSFDRRLAAELVREIAPSFRDYLGMQIKTVSSIADSVVLDLSPYEILSRTLRSRLANDPRPAKVVVEQLADEIQAHAVPGYLIQRLILRRIGSPAPERTLLKELNEELALISGGRAEFSKPDALAKRLDKIRKRDPFYIMDGAVDLEEELNRVVATTQEGLNEFNLVEFRKSIRLRAWLRNLVWDGIEERLSSGLQGHLESNLQARSTVIENLNALGIQWTLFDPMFKLKADEFQNGEGAVDLFTDAKDMYFELRHKLISIPVSGVETKEMIPNSFIAAAREPESERDVDRWLPTLIHAIEAPL